MANTSELEKGLNELKRLTGITLALTAEDSEQEQMALEQIRCLCLAYREKYNKNDWQTQIINSNVGTYINERNTYLYGEAKDTKKAEEVNKKIEEIIGKLDNNDWKYFANDEVKKLEENLKALEEQKNNIEDKQELDELNQSIELAKIDLEAARCRVDKDIKYGNDYLNTALDDYQNNSKTLASYKKDEKLSFKEQKEYNQSLENKEVSKYIIENKQDVNKVNDVRGILKSFFDEYGLFIIVLVVSKLLLTL